jgi:glucose-1-phosphate adenylyltransferase
MLLVSFVDILAAEQTPDNPTWFQGTSDGKATYRLTFES